MSPYEATIHAQDATLGRVQEVLEGIVQAGQAAAQWTNVDVAVAYASRGGVKLLCDSLESQASWVPAAKRFLVSMDFGITEPAALELLARQPNLEVRIPNGQRVLASRRLIPPHTFHAKGYLFRATPLATPQSLIIGSANLSVSALATGSEIMARQTWTGRLSAADTVRFAQAARFLTWFEDAWASADTLASLLPSYKALRKKRRIGPLEDDKTTATRKFVADPSKVEVVGRLAVQLAAAKSLWVHTDTLYVNLQSRGVGNQLDTPRGTRVFFGFSSSQVPKNHVFGNVELQVNGHASVQRSVRFGNNMMDKVNLPVPGLDGPANYNNAVLIFDRAGAGLSGLPRFRVTVTDEHGLAARKLAAANHLDLEMHGGRPYGLLF